MGPVDGVLGCIGCSLYVRMYSERPSRVSTQCESNRPSNPEAGEGRRPGQAGLLEMGEEKKKKKGREVRAQQGPRLPGLPARPKVPGSVKKVKVGSCVWG